MLGLLVGCGSASPGGRRSSADDAPLRYTIRAESDLSSLEVELCFREPVRGGLIPGRSEAGYRLRYARWLSPGPVKRLVTKGGKIVLPEGAREGCIGYGVSLADGGSLSAIVKRVDESVLAGPNAWLWRPHTRSPTIRAELTLDLPDGVVASLPWLARNGKFELTASAFAFDSHAAFGKFESVEVSEEGVRASAALLGGLTRVDTAGLERWLRGAVQIAAQSDGVFPASHLQVVVVTQTMGREPFGSVARGGGASVLMFMPREFGVDDLRSDWVLPHELSHLLLPFVARDDAWLPEGLATYYQEVLRARAGLLSEAAVVRDVTSAMRSAARQGTGRSLCEESRAMHRTGAYRAAYWGGAAYWLIADVALRERSSGTRTLDELLTSLRRDARLTPPYSAQEIVALLDKESGTSVFSELAADCEQSAFPDFEPTVAALQSSASLRAKLFSN